MAIDPKLYQQLLEIFHQELQEHHQELIAGLLAIESADETARQKQLEILFRASHNVKGAAKSVSLDDIATIAHQLEDKFSEWKTKNYQLTKFDIDHCIQQADNLLDAFNKHRSSLHPNVEILKIPLSKIENANTKADEFIAYRLRLENWSKSLLDCISSLNEAKNTLLKKDKSSNVYFLKPLAQLKIISDNASQFLGEFSRSLQNLQDDLRIMRLIPVDTILKPLERVVHELANEMHKEVLLTVEGADIEIDKSILDHLKDPLRHLVRNAIDHGIETNEERKNLEKPNCGMICISVLQDAGKIKIIFKDDGRGIDVEQLKLMLLKKELVTQEVVEKLNHADILNFIFHPGFTTRSSVTELSGRGVGLDIVKTNVELVKGSIQIETEKNIGTTFILTLPLTMATTRGVFFSVNKQQFMLPTLLSQRLYELNSSDLKPVDGELTYLVNDIPIPIKLLVNILQLENDSEERTEFHGILIQENKNQLLILVDKIENEHECVIKSLPAPFNQNPLYIGVALTDVGTIVPALNPKNLLKLASKLEKATQGNIKKIKKNIEMKRILVVDDSITTRSLAVHSLSAAGYKVESANNGVLAWELLKKSSFNCVITDIEMPEMNGFELTSLVKSDEQLKKTPVVIMSSHESDEDKKRGLKSGADAYLVKSQFDTQSLINVIERFV